MNVWVWVWVALAVVLFIAELFTPGRLLLPWAIGSAIAALFEFIRPGSLAWQWGAFFLVSMVLVLVFARRDAARRD